MDLYLNIMIFIMGTFFGSFFTLAVYRIPLKKNITHEHSFCPNCNHKLGVWDLIPVWSYLFLRGRCRYCGEKVRVRYLLLEILSGIVFVIAFQSFHMQAIVLDSSKMINFVFFVLMYVTLVLIAGIDKEYRKINMSVLTFGAICQAMYILYLYVIEEPSMYRYSIYFAIFVLLFILNNLLHRKKAQSYFFQVFNLCLYIMASLGVKALGLIYLFTMIVILFLYFLPKGRRKKLSNIAFGFIIAILAIAYPIIENFVQFY